MGKKRNASIIGFLACSVLLSGCARVSRVPLYELKEATGRVQVQTTVSDPHAFAPTAQRSWLEECTYERLPFEPGGEDYGFKDCSKATDPQFTTASGYISGLAGPLLYSGAALGSAALIGNGLADSRSTTSTSITTRR